MSSDSHSVTGCSPPPRRSRVIAIRTQQAIHGSGLNILKFASRVAELYNRTVAPLDRCVDFHDPGHTVESAARAELANGKLVDRFLKGVVRFPADLEECWVDAMPEPQRSDLIRELAWRYNLIGAKLPTRELHEHLARLSDVLADAGKTAQALAPMCATGILDAGGENGQRIAHSVLVIDRAIGDLMSLREQIKSQVSTPDRPAGKATATTAKRRR